LFLVASSFAHDVIVRGRCATCSWKTPAVVTKKPAEAGKTGEAKAVQEVRDEQKQSLEAGHANNQKGHPLDYFSTWDTNQPKVGR